MIDLIEYGLTPEMLTAGSRELPARVTAVHKDRFELICRHGEVHATLKSAVYYHNAAEPFPTTGDFVLIDYNPSGDSRIVATLPRRSYFSRRDPDPGRGEQAVAANFDTVFIMASLNNNFSLRRIERYLSLGWQSGATPAVILTKRDLTDDWPSLVHTVEEIAFGVGVHAVSAVTGEGLDALSAYIAPGKTVVFLGSSGVGKSSLVNALAGETVMDTRTVRESDDRGRHTTTHRQLIRLPSSAMIIDTPGMREIGLWDAADGLGESFPDVRALLGQCRFSDCRHETEPGCAVLEAIASGALTRERWESYQKLQKEQLFAQDKAEAMRAKNEWTKSIARQVRLIEKTDKFRHGGF